ncbi:MAG TPA: sodium/proton-translocating pyrophosphatase, partial [Syntrophorhabdaceae bacterium]|nr:sodium/proton-translocating pyrophosphatase [Syntrophorhabdaceae bacterium]
MNFEFWIYLGIFGGVVSIGVAIYLFFWVKRQEPGSERAREVASWIKEGAQTYLKRLYTSLTTIALILGVVIAVLFSFNLEDMAVTGLKISPSNGLVMA